MYHNSCKNDRPLKEARALVIDMCAGQLERPNIPASRLKQYHDEKQRW